MGVPNDINVIVKKFFTWRLRSFSTAEGRGRIILSAVVGILITAAAIFISHESSRKLAHEGAATMASDRSLAPSHQASMPARTVARRSSMVPAVACALAMNLTAHSRLCP
jgi:hypothetical protein